MILEHNDIKKAIIRSQHCQRNWDLSKELPQEDLDLIVYAASNCPSKQNVSFYNVHAITNRDVIEKIYSTTSGFSYEGREMTNSQVLANLVLVFSANNSRIADWRREQGTRDQSLLRDQQMATGVAAGYTNLLSSMLGYNTGCCACFNNKEVGEILGLEDDVLLIMGIGFKDKERNRRVHHEDETFTFPSFKKEEINVTYIK
jgi:nitroreductase